MTVEFGDFAQGSTGNTTVVLNTTGFTPSLIRFSVGQLNGSSDSVAHYSCGFTDGTYSHYDSVFGDGSGHKSISGTNKVISHWARVSGTLTEVIAATIVSIASEEFTLHFSAANSSYLIKFEAIG